MDSVTIRTERISQKQPVDASLRKTILIQNENLSINTHKSKQDGRKMRDTDSPQLSFQLWHFKKIRLKIRYHFEEFQSFVNFQFVTE